MYLDRIIHEDAKFSLVPWSCRKCRSVGNTARIPLLHEILYLASGANLAYSSSPVKELLLEQTAELPQSAQSVIRTTMRTITWPVNHTFSEQTHDGPEPRYVSQRTVKITENGVDTRYGAGEVFWYSARFAHMTENVDTIPTTVLIVEILPYDS